MDLCAVVGIEYAVRYTVYDYTEQANFTTY